MQTQLVRGQVIVAHFTPMDTSEIGKKRPAVIVSEQSLACDPNERLLQTLQVVPLSFQLPSVPEAQLKLTGDYEGRAALATHFTSVSLEVVDRQKPLPPLSPRQMGRLDQALDLVLNSPPPATAYPEAGEVFRPRDPRSKLLYMVVSAAFVTSTRHVQTVPLCAWDEALDPQSRPVPVNLGDSPFVALIDQVASVSPRRFGTMVANFDPGSSRTFQRIKQATNRQLGLSRPDQTYALGNVVL